MVHELDVTLLGLGDEPVTVSLKAGGAAQDNAGSIAVDGLVSYGWLGGDGIVTDGGTITMTAADNSRTSLIVRVGSDLRFRPKVDVEVSDAS